MTGNHMASAIGFALMIITGVIVAIGAVVAFFVWGGK